MKEAYVACLNAAGETLMYSEGFKMWEKGGTWRPYAYVRAPSSKHGQSRISVRNFFNTVLCPP